MVAIWVLFGVMAFVVVGGIVLDVWCDRERRSSWR